MELPRELDGAIAYSFSGSGQQVKFGSVDVVDDAAVADVAADKVATAGVSPFSTASEVLIADPYDSLSRCSSVASLCTLATGDSDYEPPVDEVLGNAMPLSSVEPSMPQSSREPWVGAPDAAVAAGLGGTQGAAAVAAPPLLYPPVPPRPSAAVAAQQQRWHWRPVRNTDPLQSVPRDDWDAAPARRSDVLNDRADVGNIGWMFGNWGSRAHNAKVQKRIDIQMKHGPAHIIGLCEAESETQRYLESPEVPADDSYSKADDLR